jgi:hypothetical protein
MTAEAGKIGPMHLNGNISEYSFTYFNITIFFTST